MSKNILKFAGHKTIQRLVNCRLFLSARSSRPGQSLSKAWKNETSNDTPRAGLLIRRGPYVLW